MSPCWPADQIRARRSVSHKRLVAIEARGAASGRDESRPYGRLGDRKDSPARERMVRNPTVQHDVRLSDVLWYRIGGPARYLLNVRDRKDLARAVEFVERERPARVLVIGLGANLLMPDDF